MIAAIGVLSYEYAETGIFSHFFFVSLKLTPETVLRQMFIYAGLTGMALRKRNNPK